MSYRDGFEVVEKVVRGVILKCKRCGQNISSRWGLAKKHAAKHDATLQADVATPVAEPTREAASE